MHNLLNQTIMIRFLTGLATGVTIAYLTAPRSGKQTRDKLIDFTKDEIKGVKLIQEQWDKTVSQVKNLVDVVKSNTGLKSPSLFDSRQDGKLETFHESYQKELPETDN